MIQTILLFFIMTWGYGFTLLTLLNRKFEDVFERNILRLGVGLGVFPILAVILNLLHIPLHWLIFLILSLIGPIWYLYKSKFKIPKFDYRIKKSHVYILIVLLITVVFFLVYLKGAFTYPYLEDDDPWAHAEAVKYISIEKTAYEPPNYNFKYLDPYPPSYDILLGILHQTNNSLMWTLKFFNVLIISLGIIFFYYFVNIFTKNKNKALLSTFIIAVTPSFMSHFIWSQSLALVLFFPAFYSLHKTSENKKWSIISAIIIASILVTQPSAAAIFGLMAGLYWVGKLVSDYFNKQKVFSKNNNLILLSLISGLLVSMIYWGDMFLRYGLRGTIEGIGILPKMFSSGSRVDTSGGIVYNIRDYLIAPLVSKMDQPTGLGIMVFLLTLFAIVIFIINFNKIKKNHYVITALMWLLITFLGTEGNALPFKLFPHRFWAFMAIPIAIIAAEAVFLILKSIKTPTIKYTVLSIIIIGLLWTSAYPKYVVETSNWPAGVSWSSYEEINGYVWLKTLPADTKVFTYSTNDKHIIGFDKYSCSWCSEVVDFRENILERNASELHSFLRNNDYKYVAVSGMSTWYLGRKYGENKTTEAINTLFKEMQGSNQYGVAYQTNGAIILDVR